MTVLPLHCVMDASPAKVDLISFGNKTLTFKYMVQEGDSAPDLDYASSTALSLNGGLCTMSIRLGRGEKKGREKLLLALCT